jgi:hypothetical protein
MIIDSTISKAGFVITLRPVSFQEHPDTASRRIGAGWV